MDSVKDKDYTKSYIIERFIQVLQVWIYYHFPEFAAGYGELIEGNQFHLWFPSKVAKAQKWSYHLMYPYMRKENPLYPTLISISSII